MRAPRYRFPESVRETTRVIAARMVRERTITHTPEELEAWIASEPEVKASLESGGYVSSFNAHDLFPLLEAAIVREGGKVGVVTETVSVRRRGGAALVIGLLIVAIAVAFVVLR